MKICIYGAGAIGAYLGAELVDAGYDVTLIARGPHLAAMQAQTAALPAVKAVTNRGQTLEIEVHQTQEALLGLLATANTLDAQITSLNVLEPNLETVFLHLTGKQLRD